MRGRYLRFWKTQTIGNDFVLLHGDDVRTLGIEGSLEHLSLELCERRFGIGSDGLLVLQAEDGDLHVRMFNPDGTEDFCGNGLRCAALHAFRQGWVGAEHRIEHFGRLVNAIVLPDGYVRTATGPAVYDPEEVPLALSLHPEPMVDEQLHGYVGSALSTGTTHFVTFVSELPNDDEFFRVGPMIENAPVFPERTSVMFAKETGDRQVEVRIWERGAGETQGCGTGSSAVAAEWMRKHKVAGSVEVRNPGGTLIVSAEAVGESLVAQSVPMEAFSGNVDVSKYQDA